MLVKDRCEKWEPQTPDDSYTKIYCETAQDVHKTLKSIEGEGKFFTRRNGTGFDLYHRIA